MGRQALGKPDYIRCFIDLQGRIFCVRTHLPVVTIIGMPVTDIGGIAIYANLFVSRMNCGKSAPLFTLACAFLICSIVNIIYCFGYDKVRRRHGHVLVKNRLFKKISRGFPCKTIELPDEMRLVVKAAFVA